MTDSIARFWDKYIEISIKYGVKQGALRWHVKYAEDYIKFHEGKRLLSHTGDDVRHYLNAKYGKPHFKDWQFRQVVTALKILFSEYLNLSWAKEYEWDRWIETASTLPADHGTIARDLNPQQAISDLQSMAGDADKKLSLKAKVAVKFPAE